MRSFKEHEILHQYEVLQEHRKWIKELPYLNFKKEWDVKIIPPFGKAIIRFCIDYNDKRASVYFDGYSELGFMYGEEGEPIPYFEFYDGKDIRRYLMDESEQMMKDIEEYLES